MALKNQSEYSLTFLFECAKEAVKAAIGGEKNRDEYSVENLKLSWLDHKNCKTHPKGKKRYLFIFQ